MILNEIKKLQTYKQRLVDEPTNERLSKKIQKIETKFSKVTLAQNEVVDSVYHDKYGNVVCITKEDKVLQIKGTSYHPYFISFLYAYLAITLSIIPLGLIAESDTFLSGFLQVLVNFISPLGILICLGSFVYGWQTMKKYKWIFVIQSFTLTINIVSTISHFM